MGLSTRRKEEEEEEGYERGGLVRCKGHGRRLGGGRWLLKGKERREGYRCQGQGQGQRDEA
jgi:hypothetical protein